MGLLSRLRSHAAQHVVGYIALAIAISGGTAYAANEWTGDNIVDDSLTAADIDESTLGVQDTGVVKLDLPATPGLNSQQLIVVDGNAFRASCTRRANGGTRVGLRVRYGPGVIAGESGEAMTPPRDPSRLLLDIVPTEGIPVRGATAEFTIMSSSSTLHGTAWAAVNLDGTDDCYFAVTVP